MHILLLLVAIHALLLGFAFLFAGWCTLLVADATEEAEAKQAYERARQQGWLAVWLWYRKWRQQFTGVQKVASHWRHRPDARKLIYAGAALLALAAILGLPLGVYR